MIGIFIAMVILGGSAMLALTLWPLIPKPCKKEEPKKEEPPKGWSEHRELSKGNYRIVTAGTDHGLPYFKETPLFPLSGASWISIEECLRICEEHRLKEEVKKEMAQEYGLEVRSTT